MPVSKWDVKLTIESSISTTTDESGKSALADRFEAAGLIAQGLAHGVTPDMTLSVAGRRYPLDGARASACRPVPCLGAKLILRTNLPTFAPHVGRREDRKRQRGR